MNKETIITILLALVSMTGQAKTFKTIKNPETMACVNVNPGELKAREIIFRDRHGDNRTLHYGERKGTNFPFCQHELSAG